jgi:hypothetical protein
VDSAEFIDKYVKSILTRDMTVIAPPLTIAPTVTARGAEFSTLSDSSTESESNEKKSSNYMVAAAANTDKEVSTNVIDYLSGIISSVADWLGLINREGNKHAAMLAKSTLPLSSGEGISQGGTLRLGMVENKDKTDNAAKVLGESIGRPIMEFDMDNTVPFLLCESLPLGVGGCATAYNPFISGSPAPTSPASLPTGPGDGGGVCMEGSNYCTVSYLKDYFNGTEDEKIVKATKASKICQGESSSNPDRINKDCLVSQKPNESDRTKDYSVGLFQINQIDRCDAGIIWHEEEKYCEIINQDELKKCVDTYLDPDTNIRKAVDLSIDGTVWSVHWRGVANNCGIP